MDDMHRKLARALRHGGDLYALADVLDMVARGDLQSFTDDRTWILTRVSDYPRKRVLDWFLIVGDIDGVRGLLPDVTAFAKSVGAATMTASGRLGWRPVAERHGWRTEGFTFTMELE